MAQEKHIVIQLKYIAKLYKAKDIAFRLFYAKPSAIWEYISLSISTEIKFEFEYYCRMINGRSSLNEEQAEDLENRIKNINLDVNQKLLELSALQDALLSIENFDNSNKSEAIAGRKTLKKTMIDIRNEIINLIPVESRDVTEIVKDHILTL